MFPALAALALLAAAWLARRALARLLLLALLHTVYRIRVRGLENVPEGGALLVANHLSFVDALLVGAAVPRTPAFLMHRSFFRLPLVGRFASMMETIPVASEDTPEEKAASLARAAELARAGRLVCIFAEGGISRSGVLLPFRRGLETIARDGSVPIVPVALDRVWGSVFSFSGGRVFRKWPRRVPYPVDVAFGAPLSGDTPAWRVRAAVEEEVARLRESRARRTRTLAWRFARAARRHARRPAVADSTGVRLTYRELLVRVLALRRAVARDLAGQARVGVLLPPGVPGAVAILALVLAGKVPVPLNYALGAAELAETAARARLARVVTSRRFLAALGRPGLVAEELALDLEDLAARVGAADKLLAWLVARLPGPLLAGLVDRFRDGRAEAVVLFSSGSTGRSKGVVLSHANVASNVQSVAQLFSLDPSDRFLGALPFFHAFGWTATLWTPLCSGASVVFHANPLEGRAVAELVAAERPTILLGTPTFLRAWLERLERGAASSLRLCVSGAERLPAELARAWEQKLGLELRQGYGCTELAPVVAIDVPDPQGGEDARGTVGRALPGVALRIVDPESGAVLPPGEAGLLLVRGPNRFERYLDEPERTREALRDGWYVTGDLAVLDAAARLSITDRLARFAKIGGEMVSHARVEDALRAALARAAPSGSAGVELAVVSLPDESRGERLAVLHTRVAVDVDAWRAELAREGLPNLFLPRRDAWLAVEALPRLGSGKLDLAGLQRLARERLAARARG